MAPQVIPDTNLSIEAEEPATASRGDTWSGLRPELPNEFLEFFRCRREELQARMCHQPRVEVSDYGQHHEPRQEGSVQKLSKNDGSLCNELAFLRDIHGLSGEPEVHHVASASGLKTVPVPTR